MPNYDIGISGLTAASKALDIIGNNIANAATPGYHRQRLDLTPAYATEKGGFVIGGGVEVGSITRMIDTFLEREILLQNSSLEQVLREYSTLRTVETVFGELTGSGGLNELMDNFFNSLQDLSAHTGEDIYQEQAISAAEAVVTKFGVLDDFLSELENQLTLEINNTVEQINLLTNQIASLNDRIELLEIGGTNANSLRDQSDQYITELSELVGVQTNAGKYGVVNVDASGMPVVISASASELEASVLSDGRVGIGFVGAYNYKTNITGGQLGGLLSLNNTLISDIRSDMDDLAAAMIQQVNQFHVEGVGSAGSFTSLTGWSMGSEDLSTYTGVTDGSIFIRVTNTSTGVITRNEITVDTTTPDSLSDIATAIAGFTGLNASVNSSVLSIAADSGYEFDFLPGVLSTPTTSTLSGPPSLVPTISISGIYSGSTTQTYTVTVVNAAGTGEIGVDDVLTIQVQDGAGATVNYNVGRGYSAGDPIDIGNGLSISLGTGILNDTEQFTIQALADSDTSGLLAAAGINTFFSGTNAGTMALDVTGERIAISVGMDMNDNKNVLRMAGLKDQTVSSLNNMTMPDFYRKLVTDVGQKISIKEMNHKNLQAVVQNLNSQQSELSGVDINDEAAQMLIFEQMFQAMAKYLSTVQSAIKSLMDII